ncbi:conserved hypothetical protein [Rhodospirillaceae bacterium LM-1]|nr:conserved hypothetical protein [Rhodospirillaceae bacterium LM-1]
MTNVYTLYSGLDFEWEEEKNIRNIALDRIDFAGVMALFDRPVVSYPSPRDDELRWVAIGEINEEVLAVVYTVRDNRIRIISARKASKRERESYRSTVARRDPAG